MPDSRPAAVPRPACQLKLEDTVDTTTEPPSKLGRNRPTKAPSSMSGAPAPPLPIEPGLSIDDLAHVLNGSRSTVERMKAAGMLPPPDYFLGTGPRPSPRWRPVTIRAWLDAQAQRARGQDGGSR
jgi:hypothetical protein